MKYISISKANARLERQERLIRILEEENKRLQRKRKEMIIRIESRKNGTHLGTATPGHITSLDSLEDFLELVKTIDYPFEVIAPGNVSQEPEIHAPFSEENWTVFILD